MATVTHESFTCDVEMVQRKFDRLAQKHNQELGVGWLIRFGCNWHASYNPIAANNWVFCNFRRYSPQPGNGAIALRQVCDLSDKIAVSLVLGVMSQPLLDYYPRFGFVPADENQPMPAFFIRKPRS